MGGICHAHLQIQYKDLKTEVLVQEVPEPLGIGGLCSFVLPLRSVFRKDVASFLSSV